MKLENFLMNAARTLLTIAIALPLLAGSDKIAPDLDTTQAGEVDVIVSYSATPTAEDFDALKKNGAKEKAQSKPEEGKTIAVTVLSSVVESIAGLPGVTYVSPDRGVKATLDFSVAAVNANVAYQSNLTGAGIIIAIVDSGISSHLDLNDAYGKSRVVYSESFVSGDSSTSAEKIAVDLKLTWSTINEFWGISKRPYIRKLKIC